MFKIEVLRNYFYSIISIFAQYFYPIIIIPYVLSIFDPDLFGLINFYENLSRYLLTLALFGIPQYAIREISKSNFSEKLKKFRQLFTLHFISTLLFLVVYILFVIFFLPDEFYNIKLIVIGGLIIFSNVFLVEWFFIGTEKFKFLSYRLVFSRLILIFIIFSFVKDVDDLELFFLTNLIFNLLIGFFSIKELIRDENFSFSLDFDFFDHIYPCINIFLIAFFIQVYTVLDVVILGFFASASQVGLYALASKIIKIPIALFSALTPVLMPKISKNFKSNDFSKINILITSSITFSVLFSIPIICLIIVFSDYIILIFSNEKFLDAAIYLQILSPLILIISLGNIIVMQFMMSISKEKELVSIFLITALSSIILTFILVPKFKALGTVLTLLIVECIVLILAILKSKKYFHKLQLDFKLFLSAFIISMILSFLFNYIKSLIYYELLISLVLISLFIVIYSSILFLFNRQKLDYSLNKLKSLNE